MCEQTLCYAETETPTSSSSWRSSLIVKSYFLLGKLEEAHEFIKKHESSGHITDRYSLYILPRVFLLCDCLHPTSSIPHSGRIGYSCCTSLYIYIKSICIDIIVSVYHHLQKAVYIPYCVQISVVNIVRRYLGGRPPPSAKTDMAAIYQ